MSKRQKKRALLKCGGQGWRLGRGCGAGTALGWWGCRRSGSALHVGDRACDWPVPDGLLVLVTIKVNVPRGVTHITSDSVKVIKEGGQ